MECLQKALDETQETIRAYDTKAEVLAIIMTLVVGIINFGLVNDICKTHCWIKFISVTSIFLGITTLFAIGMVLYPRKNLFKSIDSGEFRPKRTYYVSLDFLPSFTNLDEYLRQIDITDWKREIAYEVLKTSCIRDHKHTWFHIGLKCAGCTLVSILVLLFWVAYYG
ncbi:MAG TPA: hypothetical protein HPP97_10115 [Desulfuromonadales bacterium]|nr:hypothetical protein [Desulfuromonadales bacterium]